MDDNEETCLLVVLLGGDEVSGHLRGLCARLEGGAGLLGRGRRRRVDPEGSTTKRGGTEGTEEGSVAALLRSLGRLLAEGRVAYGVALQACSRRNKVCTTRGGSERG